MGFGFVEFGSKDAALAALEQLQGKMLAGHPLQLEPTEESSEMTSTASSKKKSSKLMVRNVPFQANRKELLTLFGSFGQLKKVRLPKKFDGNHRGFAFVDYVSSKEAAEAMKTLSRTHLYGRHLVIEWAEDETEPVDDERERIPAELAQPVNKKIRFT
jgi:multiple RNA-binding domain-containing protein 1